jgi:hypothetical protein
MRKALARQVKEKGTGRGELTAARLQPLGLPQFTPLTFEPNFP